jgi:hypothetical protein
MSEKWKYLQKTIPHLLFVIEKSINENIVIYETKVKQNSAGKSSKQSDLFHREEKTIIPSSPPPLIDVDAYWLDLDPITKQEKGKKGIFSERSELSFLEKYMAYGFQLRQITVQTTCPLIISHQLTLTACPHLPVYLTHVKEPSSNETTTTTNDEEKSSFDLSQDRHRRSDDFSKFMAVAEIDSVWCRLESIFVNMTGAVFMPNIANIQLTGTDLTTGEKKTCIIVHAPKHTAKHAAKHTTKHTTKHTPEK